MVSFVALILFETKKPTGAFFMDSNNQGPYSDQNKLLLYQVWQYFNARTKYLEILKGGSIWAQCETND